MTGKRTSTSATITINGVVHPTNGYQQNGNGLHFRQEVGNTPTPLQTGDIFEPVTVTQTIGSGSPVSLTDDPLQFVPPSVTASPPRYELDGNLLSDGRWTYTWDGENRLVKMESVAWTQPAGGYLANATFPAYTLEFAYDGLSRRVQKKTIKNGTAEMEGYLYDGWNVVMISKLDPDNGAHLARKWSCVWRPDIGSRLYARGSWQAAGGVGGLAWMQTGIAQTVAMYTYQSVTGNAEVHIPMMDHMGNVRHYYQIKSTGPGAAPATVTGQITANLDYDAFGREVRATGPKTPSSGQPPGLAPDDPWVDNLPFHFSTKFTDRESGLNYYGYRLYDPVDGRWLSRDPINEAGNYEGLRSNARTLRKSDQNLYLMVYNDPIQRLDYLGLASSCEIIVECRRVGNDPNASPQGVVIGIGSAMLNQGRPAVHCSLVVKREGFQGRRYEMGGVGGDVSPSDDRWQRYPTTPNGKGSSFCTPCECVGALAGELVDEAPPYHPLGPNCNTYIHKLLAKCGLKIKPFKLPYSAGVGHGGLLDMDEPIGAFGW